MPSLEAILADPQKVLTEIKAETRKLKKDYGEPRRTVIHEAEIEGTTDEQFIANEDVVITLSQRGYIKRVPIATYRTQHRGGKGVRGMTTREDDALMDLVVVDTHETLFFFSNRGRVYPLRAFNIAADTSRTTRGTPLVNLLPLARGEQVQAMLAIKNPTDDYLLILATRLGEVKALKAGGLSNIRPSGLNVMHLEQGDELVSVGQADTSSDVVMVSKNGQAIVFPVSGLRPRSRSAGGVRGMRVLGDDQVVAMGVVLPNSHLLVVSERGFGKSTPLSNSNYTRHARGGQGVITLRVTEKTGPVAAARVVSNAPGQEIFIISAQAQMVRITLEDVRKTGRNAQGVIVWRDREDDDYVASIAVFHENMSTNVKMGLMRVAPMAPGASTNGHRQVNGANPANVNNGSGGDK